MVRRPQGRHDLARTETGGESKIQRGVLSESDRFLPAEHPIECGKAATKRIGISPAKTQRPQRKKRYCHFDRREKSFSDPSPTLGMTGLARHLAFFAPWREEYPNPRCFMYRKICASRENFQIPRVRNIFLIKNSLLRALRALAVSSLSGRRAPTPDDPVGNTPSRCGRRSSPWSSAKGSG